MQLIDTHTHLDFSQFDEDRKEVINRAQNSDIAAVLNIGTCLSSSRKSLMLSQHFDDFMYTTVGVHPHNAGDIDFHKASEILYDLSKADRVKAIGEIGLDYYYDNSPHQQQREMFIELLELAKEVQLPVVIHSREAPQETMEILKQHAAPDNGGIMHCFAGDINMAEQALNLNFYIAVNGIITFNNAHKLRETISRVPLDRLLIETDCPYLTPTPYRGQRNEPAYVRQVAEKIAEIKGVTTEQIAARTTDTAREFMQIKGE